jgi:toxin YoeB
MTIAFTPNAWEDFEYWLENDPATAEKIRSLVKEITRTPFQGSGKPEALRFDLKGFWSRRISGEHRLVYRVEGKKEENQTCSIIACCFHYP